MVQGKPVFGFCLPPILRTFFLALTVSLPILVFSSCTSSDGLSIQKPHTMEVGVQISGLGQSTTGTAFPAWGLYPGIDCVIWVETADSQLVKTLRISTSAVQVAVRVRDGDSTYRLSHVSHFPEWRAMAKPDSLLAVNAIPSMIGKQLPEYDAVTSASTVLATPRDTLLVTQWDFTDTAGGEVPQGDYFVCAEVACLYENAPVVSGTDTITPEYKTFKHAYSRTKITYRTGASVKTTETLPAERTGFTDGSHIKFLAARIKITETPTGSPTGTSGTDGTTSATP